MIIGPVGGHTPVNGSACQSDEPHSQTGDCRGLGLRAGVFTFEFCHSQQLVTADVGGKIRESLLGVQVGPMVVHFGTSFGLSW